MSNASSLFVDTSGWVAYINAGDSQHDAAVAIVQDVVSRQRTLVTTNYILAELVALLAARLRLARPQILSIIDLIHGMKQGEIIHIDPTHDAAALSLLRARPDKDWSLVDASSFIIIMSEHSMTEALTTDHHFDQAGFLRLLSR